MSEAVDLYRGDFMEGFHVLRAAAFEEWLRLTREWLRMLALQAMHALGAYHASRQTYNRSIGYMTRVLVLEPAEEDAHRAMMILLALSGQRTAALRQYTFCCQALEDLGAEPMEETRALHERIRNGVWERASYSPDRISGFRSGVVFPLKLGYNVGKESRRVGEMKRNWKRWICSSLWLVLILSGTLGAIAQEVGTEDVARHVDVLEIEGPVTPIMISYFERGIQTAEGDGAEALIVVLNTPGGQTDLMNEIVQLLLQADVPTVVYVYPPGAYAASAGTLITLAAHVAAMAPGTTIGAASPVGSQGEDLGETMEQKIKEDLKAQARALAARRGEEAQAWAESAIEEAKAATSEEALEMGVIDFVAADMDDLLAQMDGFQVQVGGRDVSLNTAGVAVKDVPMTFVEQFLHIITNPTIAFILLTIGINAILYELSSPGGYAAGIVGAICLLLAFYSLGVLPVNYAGLILIALAFVLFVVDLKAPTHGVLTAGGIVSLIAGALVLFNSPLYRVSISAVIAVAVVSGVFFGFAVAKVVQAQRRPPVTGQEGLVGSLAQARTPLEPTGTVFVKGEHWDATATDGPVEAGEAVEIVAVDGFHLKVKKVRLQ